MSSLFSPLTLRGITLRNRIGVSPMCQYSSIDGHASDWHLVHLGSRAVGGAGLVFTEATAVEATGRISPSDLGIYQDSHEPMLRRIAAFLRRNGAAPGMQLAHAGRKASTARPWDGGGVVPPGKGGWTEVEAPSAEAFSPTSAVPHEIDAHGIERVVVAFGRAAARAVGCGFEVLEIHAAHGYLLHEFLSPLSNHRTDSYGGSFDNRVRLVSEVIGSVRAVIPDAAPIVLRVSATDWTAGGWTVEDSIDLARRVAALGVDLIDCSSGGNVDGAEIPVGAGYQTAFSQRIRTEAAIATAAVGMISAPAQADHIIRSSQADMVLLAREMLRDPYWPQRAALALGVTPVRPRQYGRAS